MRWRIKKPRDRTRWRNVIEQEEDSIFHAQSPFDDHDLEIGSAPEKDAASEK